MTYHWIEKHPLNFITIQNENYENYIHLKDQELRKQWFIMLIKDLFHGELLQNKAKFYKRNAK